ncbi:SDR family NAD(P)-dependent oxidoreductase [Niveibacterium umoris]|nr:SDR family NAD(P)-dependent oxidoreductase [Niveibacterium umoris]
MKRIAIVGATSSIAEHCARNWLRAGPAELVLIGRDASRLQRVADDLMVRSPGSAIRVIETNMCDPDAIGRTAAHASAGGSIDVVLIAHGDLPVQAECETDLRRCRDALEVNGVSPALFAEAFAQHMANAGHGTLAVIGSVAGDRGRKSNYAYGAAKGLVNRYLQGMQHRFAGTAIKVVLVKPGPTDTPMTAQLKGQGAPLAPVEQVAACIVEGIAAGRPVVYAPAKWRAIMWVIRHLPGFVFNRLNI